MSTNGVCRDVEELRVAAKDRGLRLSMGVPAREDAPWTIRFNIPAGHPPKSFSADSYQEVVDAASKWLIEQEDIAEKS